MKKSGRNLHVIVLGAGAAGLAGASELTRTGARVTILEARNRVGGRIFTTRLRAWPLPIELGAEFIHGRPRETLSLVEEARLLVDRVPDLHWLRTRRGLEDRNDFFEKMSRITSRMRNHGPDRSVADFLKGQKKLRPDLRLHFRFFVEGFHAASLDRVSEHSLSTAGEGEPEPGEEDQFRIAGGYDRLTRWLLSQARGRVGLKLSAAVSEIAWSRGRATVSIAASARRAARRLAADRVLVTVPMAVLKAPPGSPGAIRFRPSLPEKDRALSRLETGEVVKVVFRFRERFWEEHGLLAPRRDRYDFAFLHARDSSVPTWWTSAPTLSPMLTGWVGGPGARGLLRENDETVAAVALEALSGVLKVSLRRLRSLLEGWHFHNWTKDPFSRGAYSYTGVGGTAAHRALARPVAGTLFFAGEATDPDQTGTVAGAIASGQRAASEILGK